MKRKSSKVNEKLIVATLFFLLLLVTTRLYLIFKVIFKSANFHKVFNEIKMHFYFKGKKTTKEKKKKNVCQLGKHKNYNNIVMSEVLLATISVLFFQDVGSIISPPL